MNAGSSQPASSTGGPRSEAGEVSSLVCFAIGERVYALDVALVREVVPIGRLYPVPRTPAAVEGVFSLRGATVALVDTSRLLGLPPHASRERALVVLRDGLVLCGLTIDRIVGVARFEAANFLPADREREPAQVAGFLPDEQGALLTVLDSAVLTRELERLRFH